MIEKLIKEYVHNLEQYEAKLDEISKIKEYHKRNLPKGITVQQLDILRSVHNDEIKTLNEDLSVRMDMMSENKLEIVEELKELNIDPDYDFRAKINDKECYILRYKEDGDLEFSGKPVSTLSPYIPDVEFENFFL